MRQDVAMEHVFTGKVRKAAAHLEPSRNEFRASRCTARRAALRVGSKLHWAKIYFRLALLGALWSNVDLLASGYGERVPPDPRLLKLMARLPCFGVVRVYIALAAGVLGFCAVRLEDCHNLEWIDVDVKR